MPTTPEGKSDRYRSCFCGLTINAGKLLKPCRSKPLKRVINTTHSVKGNKEVQRKSLKHYWHVEVLGGPDTPFCWLRLWRRVRRSRSSHVDVGANSCIIGTGIEIGDNVVIGAMSFINKNVPSNHTYITEKTSRSRPTLRAVDDGRGLNSKAS